MIEKFEQIFLKTERPPEWLLGSIPSNTRIVTLHGEGRQGLAVPFAFLVADSEMAYTLLPMCEGPEKHNTIITEVEDISCDKILSTGKMRI